MCACLALAAGCGDDPQAPGSRGEPPQHPDVVLLMIDTLRPDHLEAYGYQHETAPWLAALAQRSALFTRAYSTSSWTAPSTASVFTGLYPTRHGVFEGLMAQNHSREKRGQPGAGKAQTIELTRLPAQLDTVAELMRAAGYSTWGVGGNVNFNRELGFARGFDAFAAYEDGSAEQLVETILEWEPRMRQARPRPYFLYAHFNDPHKPYLHRRRWYRSAEGDLPRTVARYDSEIGYLDDQLRTLSSALDWNRDTLVFVVSDHGEEFGEHGNVGHPHSLHNELNRVVMMVSGPGVEPRAISDFNASLIDVLPSLAELAGLSAPADRDGRSLAPQLRGRAGADAELLDRRLFAHRWKSKRTWGFERDPLWAVVHGQWKLIEKGDEVQLFDLASDPYEQSDLAAAEPARAAALRAELAAFRERSQPLASEEVEIHLDASQVEQLEALGYTEEGS